MLLLPLLVLLLISSIVMPFKLSSIDMQKLLQRVRLLSVPPNYVNSLVHFVVEDQIVGYCTPTFAQTLSAHPEVYSLSMNPRQLRFVPSVEGAGLAARTAAAHTVSQALRDAGAITGWRDEMLAVSATLSSAPLLLLERAAVPFFGTLSRGVHINGYVTSSCSNSSSGKQVAGIWVGTRSSTKSTWPGMLDHLAAGALPHGVSLEKNVIKECQEEASIPAHLAQQAKAVGQIAYRNLDETGQHLKRDVIYCYDLELPADLLPVPQDGEAEGFELQSVEWVLDRLLGKGDNEYKPNCNLVLIDFLLRHNLLDRTSPHYEELLDSICRGDV